MRLWPLDLCHLACLLLMLVLLPPDSQDKYLASGLTQSGLLAD